MKIEHKIEEFIHKESSAGIVLAFVTVAAMIIKNSPFSNAYESFLLTPVEVRFGVLFIGKPLLLWINDGLMAVFFLLVGIEIKQEIIRGHLSSLRKLLPARQMSFCLKAVHRQVQAQYSMNLFHIIVLIVKVP